jgi:adenine phosphoribosyltransferase
MTNTSTVETLKAAIRDIPDFPKKGIVFKDITPILANGNLFSQAIGWFTDRYKGKGIDAIVGIDARGFIFAGAVACKLGIGFIPVRKKGKLPYKTHSIHYDLEYGAAELEVHIDAMKNGGKVVIVDDLLATGGTALAAAQLLEKVGAQIEAIDFLIELGFLDGKKNKLQRYNVGSAIRY